MVGNPLGGFVELFNHQPSLFPSYLADSDGAL